MRKRPESKAKKPAQHCGQCDAISVFDENNRLRKATPAEEFDVRMRSNCDVADVIGEATGATVVDWGKV